MARPLPKVLLVFDLEGVLCSSNLASVHSLKQTLSANTVQIKPNIKEFCHFLFIRNRLYFKTGVFSRSSQDKAENLSGRVFESYQKQLLFKYSSAKEVDLNRVWLNFPEYNKTNTVYISASSEGLVQKANFLAFPAFKLDESLLLFQEYMRFFSYQYVDSRTENLELFISRVKFTEYYSEKTKPGSPKPQGEAMRFW